MKKGSLKVADYLLRIKKLVDALTYFGSLVSEEDHITYILSGLGLDYNALVVSVTSKKECYSVAEIPSLLLTNEKLLEQQAAQLGENFSGSQPKRFNTNSQGSFNGNSSGNKNVGQFQGN